MKVAFVIPVLSDCDIKQRFDAIEQACKECDINFEIIFAFNNKLNNMFSQVRSTFIENKKVKAFKVNRTVNQHKLITIAMKGCEDYDATIIYSGKETINVDVVKAFLTSWKAGNKIVYLKKVYSSPKKIWVWFKSLIYRLGTKIMGVFKDMGAETDIQLLDKDVVITINQLPEKNRHLRTLDAFVGYNTDIIKMEVDSKIKDSKSYVEKTKKYKLNLTLSIVFLVLSVLTLTTGILSVALHWKMRWMLTMLIWVGFLIMGLFSLVFFTKKELLVRVGDSEDMSDIDELLNKMEKYNF